MDKTVILNTAVEKVVHRHMQRVKEGVHDFIILYMRRNNIEVDRDSLVKIQDVTRKAFDSQHMEKIDIMMEELNEALNSFVE